MDPTPREESNRSVRSSRSTASSMARARWSADRESSIASHWGERRFQGGGAKRPSSGRFRHGGRSIVAERSRARRGGSGRGWVSGRGGGIITQRAPFAKGGG